MKVRAPSVGTPEHKGDELARLGNPGVGATSRTVKDMKCEEGKPTAGVEEYSAMVCGTRLPPDHPCLEYLKERGLDLGTESDLQKFTSNPSLNGGKRWYLAASVKGRVGEFLVDTGASHSIISRRFYTLLVGTNDDLKLRVNACTADGSRLRTFGRTFLCISVMGKEFVFSPTIAEIEDDGIIGMDFADLFGMMLNPKTGELFIEYPYDMKAQCVLRVISSVASVAQTVKIPPGTTCDVLVSSSSDLRGRMGVMEPDVAYLQSEGLESADTLVGNSHWTVMPISNPGFQMVYLRKGTKVGKVVLAEAVTSSILELPLGKQDDQGYVGDELEKLIHEASDLDPREKEGLRVMLKRCRKAFAFPGEPLGRTDKVLHGIDVGENSPFKIPYRRLPLKKREVAEAEIDKMIKDHVIVPSMSPWSSPVCMVTKKDGTIRFCIDYRKLNGMTKKNSYPLPRIDETIDSLGGNEWFCTIDLQSGYWQVGMKPEDMEKTAFSSHVGLFQYNVMPFGLCNAPATFEAMMETLLSDLLWKKCLVYLDDVIIFGKTFQSCLDNLEEVLQRIMSNGLKLKPKKCQLFKKDINYLGRIISTEGVKADPDKIRSVSEWERPKCPKDVRSFLGFCSYYRDFIPGYSKVSYPIQALSHWTPGRRKEVFPWGKEQDESFAAVKKLFVDTPVLKYPTPDDHFILDTDASNESIGAALSQVQDGKEVPIAFASNTMNRSQRNYCTTKRELLAVIVYTKKFKHFLWGSDFTLRTDHSSLRWLLNFKDAEGMIGRWLAHLSEFGLEQKQIQHRPGAKHINADALSRRPIRNCGNAKCDDCGAHAAVLAGIRQPLEARRNGMLQWSMETIKMFQEKDPNVGRLLDLIPKKIRPIRPEISLENREMRRFLAQWTELEVSDGVLYRWKINPSGRRIRQVVIPSGMRRDLMYYCHGHMTSGHFGKKRSLERLARRYYWPGMSTDLLRWIATCPDCCKNKPGPGMGKMPLSQELFGVRFARVAIDIISGFKTTPDKNTCMMVVTDYYTKYTRVFPLPDHKAATCAKAFVKGWVLHLGVPLMMHSDQGREFESDLWQEMCHRLAICKTRTNPYRPQSDGMVERFNRTLIQVLKPLVNESMTDWDEQCEYVCHAYNSTVHSSTNCSPNLLVFGEDMIMPADLVFGVVGMNPDAPCHVMFVESLRDQFKFAYELVRTELKKNAKWQKTGYDHGLKVRRFKVGDQVVRLHEPLSNLKLASNWDGPFIVTRVVSDCTVMIRSLIGRIYKSNVARLRPWKGRDLTTETYGLGVDELLRKVVERKMDHSTPKRGPGRPRKLGTGDPKVQKKKVSLAESKQRRTGKGKADPTREKAPLVARSKKMPQGGIRRSPRLFDRAAVT